MEGNLYRMTELPTIESLCLRKDFWDRHGANIATRLGERYGERLSLRQKKRILERENRFFAAVLAL